MEGVEVLAPGTSRLGLASAAGAALGAALGAGDSSPSSVSQYIIGASRAFCASNERCLADGWVFGSDRSFVAPVV